MSTTLRARRIILAACMLATLLVFFNPFGTTASAGRTALAAKLAGVTPAASTPPELAFKHPLVPAPPPLASEIYTVQPGDTLSSIALRVYKRADAATVIYQANKGLIRNYPVILVGWKLVLPGFTGKIPPPPPVQAAVSSPGAPVSGNSGFAAFEACVIRTESGGSTNAWNGPHWGVYQMTDSLWLAGGGASADWGNAATGAAEQHDVFARIVLDDIAGGAQNWTPYDGCPYNPVVTTSAPSGAYANPLRSVSNLVAQRVDMGVDFDGYGPVYAIGPGVVTDIYNGGWPYGIFICYQLTAGPDSGDYVYVAEDITPAQWIVTAFEAGQRVVVNDQTVLGIMGEGSIETGWAAAPGVGGALAGGYPGWPTAAGISFNQVLVSLGAPSGTGVTGAGPMDQGKPSGTSHARRCGWRCYPRNEAMDWALRRAGCSYSYGGTSCAPGYDCSGLVMMAYASIGIHLPRTTYDMLADAGHRHYLRHIWWVLVHIFHPKRGDLAFYGSGHVELMTKLHDETFGAHDYGSPVGYIKWGPGWAPTAFYRVEVHQRG